MESHRGLCFLFEVKLAHDSNRKEWLFLASQDESMDSLAVVWSLLEEFLDLSPKGHQ